MDASFIQINSLTFSIQLAHRCSDNGCPTVIKMSKMTTVGVLIPCLHVSSST